MSGDEPGRRAPRASRRVALTRRGACMAVLATGCLLAGWLARYPGLLGMGIAAAVTVGVSLIGLVTRRGVTVTRNPVTRPVRRLTPVTGELRIAPHAGAPGGEVDVTERVGGHRLDRRRLAVTHHGAGIEYPIPTRHPGEIVIGPAELAFIGFAGLTRMRVVDRSTKTVLVLARCLPMRLPDNGALPVESPRADEVEGGGTELRSLRPYVPGDDLRKVNARISARVGRLMIRQDAEPSISTVNLVVDNTAAAPADTYAEMLDVATSLAGAAVHAGLPLRWAARARPPGTAVGAEALGPTEVALARLPRVDDPLPRVPDADLTVVVCSAHTAVDQLVGGLGVSVDLGLLVLLRVCEQDDALPGNAFPRVVLLQAPTAEMVVRGLSHLDAGLAGAQR